MSEESTAAEFDLDDLVSQVMILVENEDREAMSALMRTFDAAHLVDILSSLPPEERLFVWQSIGAGDVATEVLEDLSDGVRATLLTEMDAGTAVEAVSHLDVAELVDVLETVEDDLADAILASLSLDERAAVEMRQGYPEDCAGRYMSSEWLAIRAEVSLDVVSRYLKRLGKLPAYTDGLLVANREGVYLGKLPLSALLLRAGDTLVKDVLVAEGDAVHVLADETEVATRFKNSDAQSLAVFDDEHQLIGRITAEDAMEIVSRLADHQLLHAAGLDEDEDLFAPIIPSAKRRLFWLGINLVTAFMASAVIGMFSDTLEKLVALAVLMPIVASMGGIAGSQTLTLAIRGLALNQINSANTRWLAMKELAIAGINGAVWAVVVGSIVFWWFGSLPLALVLAAAMVINQLAASTAGLAVPLVLDRMGIDPALSGSVVLTTVTDIVGFMSFLGLASWLIL